MCEKRKRVNTLTPLVEPQVDFVEPLVDFQDLAPYSDIAYADSPVFANASSPLPTSFLSAVACSTQFRNEHFHSSTSLANSY